MKEKRKRGGGREREKEKVEKRKVGEEERGDEHGAGEAKIWRDREGK